MDKLLSPHSPEAAAHNHLSENIFDWHTDQPSVDESLISGCASYRAFMRYLSGEDLFLLPRNRSELESILRRYAYDAIHNAIASSRSPLQTGGYSRKSIRGVLNTDNNVEVLLALHQPPNANRETEESNHTRPIDTKLNAMY
ncbi:hypothetical protein CPB84DRAFT_29277 [Gymnopilus junonius]|uniref:Uncharacterized protein n=1 Tax=Gymnopilus junonius TaxID=109634 RepID=A0A9P5P3X9_GYMJU|nr:hypothetical protein CPB84DRAFT_29277 [Gymnopilus junonius]